MGGGEIDLAETGTTSGVSLCRQIAFGLLKFMQKKGKATATKKREPKIGNKGGKITFSHKSKSKSTPSLGKGVWPGRKIYRITSRGGK